MYQALHCGSRPQRIFLLTFWRVSVFLRIFSFSLFPIPVFSIFPRPFALVCGLCELKELQGIKQRRKQKDAVCVTMETKLFVLPRS